MHHWSLKRVGIYRHTKVDKNSPTKAVRILSSMKTKAYKLDDTLNDFTGLFFETQPESTHWSKSFKVECNRISMYRYKILSRKSFSWSHSLISFRKYLSRPLRLNPFPIFEKKLKILIISYIYYPIIRVPTIILLHILLNII